MIKQAVISILCSITLSLQAQYHAPANQEGTHAIHKDSSIIRDWATSCTIEKGWKNILDTTMGKTEVGDENSAIGKALTNGVVSLGDGGSATLTFAGKIYNGPGPDFAVFENGFDEYFLELAFVEVSTDGTNFFRFPAHSLTTDTAQIKSFDSLDATKINNLAGKYQQAYGVPFDLEEMKGISGLDVEHISHVRIVDVVGTINPIFASYDKDSNIVNDPFPTAFVSGGFDLDAVGVIHLRPTSLNENELNPISVFPNPVSQRLFLAGEIQNLSHILVYDISGKELLNVQEVANDLDVSSLPQGIYLLKLKMNNQWHSTQFVKQ